MEARRRILLNTPHIETASGGVANFKTDMIAPLKGCKINFLPKQSGSGDPSPTNIRPISGWDGVEVVRCGKNLYNRATDTVDAFIRANSPAGEIVTNKTGYRASDYIRVKPNTTYTVNYNATSNTSAAGMVFYSDNNIDSIIGSVSLYRQIPEAGGVKYYTFTTTNNCNYLRFSTPPQSSNVQLEESSTPTLYEPYTTSTFPVSWAQQGTVYGGYVDLVSGELVAEYTGYTFTGDETFYTTGSWIIARPPLIAATPYKGYCSHYPYAPYGRGKIGVMYNERNCTFDGKIYDQSGWKQFCKDQYDNGTPLTIVYMIKEPIHYSFTPTQIKTLKGINNVYSNADSAEVKFWTH